MPRLFVCGCTPADPLVRAALAAAQTRFTEVSAVDGSGRIEPLPGSTDLVLIDCSQLKESPVSIVERLQSGPSLPIILAVGCKPDDADSLRLKGVDQALSAEPPAAPLLGYVADLLVARREVQIRFNRATEAQLRCEQRFREIFERNVDGFVVIDSNGDIRFLNEAAADLLGRTRESLRGQNFGFPVVAGETAELEMVRPDRECRIVEMRVTESEWDGAPALLASLRDITERREAAEQEVRLAEERAARAAAEAGARRAHMLASASRVLSESFDSDLSLMRLAELAVSEFAEWCIIDLVNSSTRLDRHTVAHANAAHDSIAAELRRLNPALAARGPASSIRNRRAEFVATLDNDALLEIEHDAGTRRLYRQMGARSMIIVPLEARGRVLGAATFIRTSIEFEQSDLDCAEELAQRVALALDNARLFEASLIASQAKSDFLATISHELRTPLNAIMGYADLLQNGIVQPTPQALNDYLSRVIRSATTLHEMIEDVLNFESAGQNRDQIQVDEVSLSALLEDVLSSITDHAASKGLTVRIDCSNAPETIRTDASKLAQILKHLLRNAIKFSESGEVRIEVSTSRDSLCIDVIDTGIGIAPEHLERIFDPFWQVERALTRRAGGAGLGLSLARRYAHLLGGDIRVRTEAGKGSTFTVRIPLAAKSVPAEGKELPSGDV